MVSCKLAAVTASDTVAAAAVAIAAAVVTETDVSAIAIVSAFEIAAPTQSLLYWLLTIRMPAHRLSLAERVCPKFLQPPNRRTVSPI